ALHAIFQRGHLPPVGGHGGSDNPRVSGRLDGVDDCPPQGQAHAGRCGRQGERTELCLRRHHDLRKARRYVGARGERFDIRAGTL
ncbi:MAG: hypothetical protein AVDCRST_MAG71-1873, partial [uncultured Lysobacter sp.]